MHNIIFLKDLEGDALDPYVRLNEVQLFHATEEPGMFIAESPKVIERALRAGYRPASLLMEEGTFERDLADLDHEMAANHTSGLGQTPIYIASRSMLRQLAGAGYNFLRGALSAMHRVPFIGGPAGYRWERFSKCRGPILTQRFGRQRESIFCIAWVIGRPQWRYGIIPSVLMILNWMRSTNWPLFLVQRARD